MADEIIHHVYIVGAVWFVLGALLSHYLNEWRIDRITLETKRIILETYRDALRDYRAELKKDSNEDK